MKRAALFLLALCMPTVALAGQTLTTVNCNSSTAGVQIVAALGSGTAVTVPTTCPAAIWVAKTESTCSSAFTAIGGYRLPPGTGYDFTAKDDGYTGQLCCLAESGSATCNVTYNKR